MARSAWRSQLRYDPVPALASSTYQPVAYIAQRDFLGEHKGSEFLWQFAQAKSILGKQQSNGSWRYSGGNNRLRSAENYDQLETIRNLGYLVQMFQMDMSHPAVANAADFLLGFQTSEGDIRGILGNQYTPYYTAIILELLLAAGCADRRIDKAFAWLTSVRQDDGGWAIPLRTQGAKLEVITSNSTPMPPDTTKPSSHMVTGIVLRAYAAHKTLRHSVEAKVAGELLLTRFFMKDFYPDRAAADFWTRFSYPFWFTDLISALDSLSKLGFSKDNPAIHQALTWFIDRQGADGLWQLKTLKNDKKYKTILWLDLALCHIFERLL